MKSRRDFLGAVTDAASGPVGSKAWVESRADRHMATLLPVSAEEREELNRRLRAATAAARSPKADRTIPILGEAAICENGQLERVADFDDSPALAHVDHSPVIAARHEAERIFRGLCHDETGVIVDPVLLARKQEQRAVLRAQSHEIARKLELAHVPAYRSEQWSLWTYGIHSGEVEVIPQFRRVAFIPFIAAAIREPFVRSLEYFLSRYPFARFWTFSSGQRCRVEELRERLQELHRRISALNGADFMKAAGVEIVFRSSELGTVEGPRKNGQLDPEAGAIGRDEQGRPLYHPHAHCVALLTKGRMARAEWSAFLEKVWAYWQNHWQDGDEFGGPIRNVRELVKYVSKPSEIENLTPDETAALFHALRRLKLVQPMGILAEEIKARKAAGRTLVRQRTDDGFIWVEVADWNKREPTDETRHTVTVEFGDEESPQEISGEVSERDMIAAARLDGADADCCVVVARCAPSASRCGLTEPRVVVMGKRWDAARVKDHPLVQRLRLATFDAWHAGLALIRVHTGTPTVGQQSPLGFLPDVPERIRPPADPVFAALAK
jgi:hypothetical protein